MKRIFENKGLLISVLIIFTAFLLLFIFKSKIIRNEREDLIPDSAERKVSLIITPEYDEYFIDQLIWIKINVANNSNENYYLKSPLKRSYVSFAGTYPSGKNFTDSLSSDIREHSDSLSLEPGSSFEKVIPVNISAEKFYGEEKKETGNYKINAMYQNLTSNDLNINVSGPPGIDKEIYDKTYGKLFTADIPQYEKIQKLGELLKKYPGTKYSPQLYKIYFSESNYSKDYNNNSDDINYFFENNSDTYGADLILDIGNVNFEKLLSKYRDSKTGYMIRQRKKEALTLK